MPILQLEDADIHYETFGEGKPFLFLAATATLGEVWKRFQIPDFSRDHRVIIFDQRGTGQTKTNSKDFSTGRLAADAAALLDHIEEKNAIVLGHSMGGRVAQVLALDHPGYASKLILASTGASFPTRGIPLSMCLELVERGYERYLHEHSVEVGFTPEFVAANRKLVDDFLAVRLSHTPSLETFLRLVIARTETDTSARLKDIRVPTLVTVADGEGQPDASGISHIDSSEALARDIPNARFEVIRGHGHYYLFVDPEPTHKIIRDFLAKT